MRILLTGAGGQLGTDVSIAADDRTDIDLVAFDRAALDIVDADAVKAAVSASKPDVVLHAAAFTAVDLCETEHDLAHAVNVDGTRNVAEAAARTGARMLFISTDYVFDGTKAGPYVESDPMGPASVYGTTKMLAETLVAETLGDDGLCVRTSWVCGRHGSNMVKTILRVAESHDTLTFVDDQIGKPTFTHDLAPALLDLAAHDVSGTMHVTNEGHVSWYEFCGDVLEAAGLDRTRVRPCATHELQPPRPAPRPANSVLANTRFESLDMPFLRDFREPLKETVRDLTS